MPKSSLVKRKEWEKKLEAWKESGLSGPKWCIENNENYPRFQYWKSALKMTDPRSLFKELKEESPEPIAIECLPQRKIETNRDVISRVLGAQISCSLARPNAL